MSIASDKAKATLKSGQKINLELTRELVKEAIATKGEDYVYTNPDGASAGVGRLSCFNLHPKNLSELTGESFMDWYEKDRYGEQKGDDRFEGGCVVGTVQTLVFPIDQIHIGGGASSDNTRLGHPFTEKAAYYLQHLQSKQDDGLAWGLAEAEAYAVASDLYERASDSGAYPENRGY